MELSDVTRFRRIVTGVNLDGESYLARVEEAKPADYQYVLPPEPKDWDEPGVGSGDNDHATKRVDLFRIWGSDWLPIALPTDGLAPMFEFGPRPEETPEALRRASALPPPLGMRIGIGMHPRSLEPGRMHWTDSTDLLFVMAGQHGQILDDGAVLMHPGDVLVQNGTNHAHHTITDAVLGYVVVSAMRVTPPPPIELMNPISGSVVPYRGGYRIAEARTKRRMEPWQAPRPSIPAYPSDETLPRRIEDLSKPRRVVTGTTTEGRSYFARIEGVEEIDYRAAGAEKHGETWKIWQSDKLPNLVPTDGRSAPLFSNPSPEETPEVLRRSSLQPQPLGMVATIHRIPADAGPGPTVSHDALDAVFIMTGEVTLTVDTGEITLGPGDVVIQNGTRHAWHNRGRAPAVFGVASFGGARLQR